MPDNNNNLNSDSSVENLDNSVNSEETNNDRRRPRAPRNRPNDDRNTRKKRVKGYSTKNYFYNIVGNKIENSNVVLTRTFDELDENVLFPNTIVIDYTRLRLQANVFAKAILGEKFDKRYVFGTRDNVWIERAQQIYIYSYFRALTYGAFSFREDDLDTNYFLFIGHAILGESLRAQRFSSMTSKGNVIQLNLSLGFDFEDEIPTFERVFPFLENCFVERSNGKWYVSNPLCDNWLSRLSEQELVSISLIELRTKADEIKKFIDVKVNPFGNSALSKSGDATKSDKSKAKQKFLFVSADDDFSFNQSIWLPIATFANFDDRNFDYQQSYYEGFDRYERDWRLVKYEVHSVTYLRCSTTPDLSLLTSGKEK